MSFLLRGMALISALFILMGLVASVDSLKVGGGTQHDYFNVNSGARQTGQGVYIGSHGFAAPSIPQPVALSPGFMVQKVETLVNNAEEIKDESMDIYNQTLNLSGQIKADEKQVQSLAVEAGDHEEASKKNAALAERYARENKDVYNMTKVLSQGMDAHMERAEDLFAAAQLSVNISARNAALAGGYLNGTRSFFNGTQAVYKEELALGSTIRELENISMASANLSCQYAGPQS
jgi:hypothetical protein